MAARKRPATTQAQTTRQLLAIRIANREPLADIARDLGMSHGVVKNIATEPAVKAAIEAERSRIIARTRKTRDARAHRLELLADRAVDRLETFLDPKTGADTKTVLEAAKMVLARTNPIGVTMHHTTDAAALPNPEKLARLLEIVAAHPDVLERDPQVKATVLALCAPKAAADPDVVDGEVENEGGDDGE